MDRKVAIIGYSFRLPGTDPENFWENLQAGRDLVTQVPEDRWAQEAYFHPRKSEPGTSYSFAAGTLGDVSGFDAGFFGISPREAGQMDPQQRLLLELTWEAFERGGIRPSSVRGSSAAVYLGFSSSDYSYRRTDDLASMDASTMTGNTASVAANRISYQFDLRGPSMAVDTACSSSLVAFHQACQSIRCGESPLAVVGGVSLHLHPFPFVGFSRASMLSPRGRCHVFDASGDGYVRSEGAGVFLLKGLEEALADENRIYAVVAASGVNCDGKTHGITVPGCETQAALLRGLYAEAGIAPTQVDYIEAHGTGTAVGDPIETRALGLALGGARGADAPLLIGSVKSNLGHLEAASGVAGLAKALACLQHRSVPPTIHLTTVNPNIKLDEWNLAIVKENTPLASDRQLTVGINSFGFGGANAHVILQSPADAAETAKEPPQSTPVGLAAQGLGSSEMRVGPGGALPLLLSARSPEALRASAGSLATWLGRRPQVTFYEAAYSLLFHRDQHMLRAVVFPEERDELLATLQAFADGHDTDVVAHGTALPEASRPVFVYSGNGSQWAGMGSRLLDVDAVFRDAVVQVDALFRQYADFSIVDELRAEEGSDRLALTEVAQPTLFAVQIGLTEMLRGWGVAPAAVVGHSVGEVAAAWAGGALSLEQAVRVIAERSLHQARTRGIGGMTAVGMGAEALQPLLRDAGLADRLVIAGVNSPRGVTLAGDLDALQAFEGRLAEREVFQRRLKLDYAFHSPAMDPIAESLQKALQRLRPRTSTVPFYSTVTGGRLAGERLGASYWWRNVREPVQFEAAVTALIEHGHNVFVEIGPSAILRNYVGDCLREQAVEGAVVPTMLRGDDSLGSVRQALGQLLIAGAPVDLERLFPDRPPLVDLPTYAWQHESYWHPVTAESYGLLDRRKVHPLLGYALHESETEWENRLDTESHPNLRDHAVGEAVVFPAAGFVEMALAAGHAWQGGEVQEIEELEIRAPLLLEDGRAKTVRLRIDASDGSFTIRSRDRLSDDPWLVNVVGRLLADPFRRCAPDDLQLPRLPPDSSGDEHYRLTDRVGLFYGPAFQTVEAIWQQPGAVLVRFRTPPVIEAELAQAWLHPGYLDGCFQSLVDLLRRDILTSAMHAFVPVKIGRLRLLRRGAAPVYARASLVRRGPRSLVAAYTLYDGVGGAVAQLDEVRFRAVQLRHGSVEHADFLAFHSVPGPRAADRAVAALPAVEYLLQSCRARLHGAERRSVRQAYYGEVEPLLDVLCASFAERALRQLVDDDAVVEPRQLIDGGVVEAEHAALLSHLIDILEEDGVLEPTESGWRWAPEAGLPAPGDVWISVLGDYPDFAAELLMVGRVGMHLPEVLSGMVSDAAVVPQGCASAVLEHYQASSPSVTDLHLAVVDLVRTAMRSLPEGRRLRILEWSSCGTSLTTRVLPVLDFDRCDYVLAAPDQRTLDDREVLLEHHPEVQPRLLSLAGDGSGAEALGSDPAFDLVLLSGNELDAEAAERLFDSLRKVVAADGLVILLGQYPSRWTDLVFGLRSDWWGDDGTRHRHARTRIPAAWQTLAARHGFGKAELVRDLPEVESGAFLMLLRASAAVVDLTPEPPAAPATWILLQDRDGYGAALANSIATELRVRGHGVVTATPGRQFAVADDGGYELDPGSADQFGALLAATRALYGDVHGVVHLYAVNPGRADLSSAARLDAMQRRCVALTAMLQACESQQVNPACWLVTTRAALGWLPPTVRAALGVRPGDGDDAPLWGVGRTAMNEYPDRAIRLVDCADTDKLERMSTGLLHELLAPDAEDEIVLTGDGRYAPRLRARPLPALPSGDDGSNAPNVVRLDFTQPGPLKHLAWRAERLAEPVGDQVEIEVRAAGLNFRDVMYAMGLLSDEAVEAGFAGPTLGMELSGVIRRVGPRVSGLAEGDEVIAFAPASFASRALTTAGAVVPKPAGWTFEAAATIPTAFFTVYYALQHLAGLAEGERILIHGAAGGVGIAAVQFAKLKGAEIFATAGSAEKRDFLRLLGVDHVMDSRSLAFADEILELTEGQGVDVVLNSLAGEAINRNLRVLRPFGRFLELGKRDFYENTRIGLRPFRNNISYYGIDADQLMSERPDLTRRLFRELMGLFEQGELKPLPFRTFPATEVLDAFRYMQQSKQIGKVVISFRGDIPAGTATPRATPHLVLPADASYLVTGGLGGFGLKTAQWLASKGARHLVLLGRRGLASPEAEAAVGALRASGVEVQVHACDVTRRGALEEVLQATAAALPPLRGVVHAAMVVADGLLRNQDEEKFHKVLAPKVLGARHLHELTAGLDLDFFVLYSSATTLFGNPGQGNYVAANRYLEALAEDRRAQGLPAICLSWGAIDDVGYLARRSDLKDSLQSRMGGAALVSDEALHVLEQALLRDGSGFGVMDLDWSALRRFLPTADAPKYAELARHAEEIGGETEGLAEVQRLLEELDADELHAAFTDLLKREVAEILRIPPERLDEHRSMYDQGMDSLMGMELVAAVEARFGVNLPIMALSEGPTIVRLVERIVRQLKTPQGDDGSGPEPDLSEQVRTTVARHAGELGAADVTELAAALEESASAPSSLLGRR